MNTPAIIHKFSGPPGTGKSTTLLNVVESLLSSGVDPEHIVYTTFTRAGAYEARDRACARFKLPPSRLPYFKTLHALCHGLMPSRTVMRPGDWCVVAKKLGIFFSVRVTSEDISIPLGYTRGDSLLSLWSLMRVTRRPLDEILRNQENFLLNSPYVTKDELLHFIETVNGYKSAMGMIDFTDMLENWLNHGADMNCDYVIVDEAQDLSALQWGVVNKLCAQARKIWVAGDDDQCIHEWNGASPQHFIDLVPAHYEVLPQSYRIPSSVHALAETVIKRVSVRLPKEYKPREEPGAVTRISDLSQLNMDQGTWFMLARNNVHLADYAKFCRDRGYLYNRTTTKDSYTLHVNAIHCWKRLVAGETLRLDEILLLYSFLPQKTGVARGAKILLSEAPKDLVADYDDLKEEFGLVAPKESLWHEIMALMLPDDREYMKSAERRDPTLGPVRILIASIHAVKGAEADHVVLRADMQMPTYLGYLKNADNEHRVFYVGVTRAKQTLYLLPAKSERAYPL